MIAKKKLDAKVAELLDALYVRRFAKLQELTLSGLLEKNPYLYRAIGIQRSGHFLDGLLAARISSSDETIFSNEFFAPLALWAATQAKIPGRKVSGGAGAGQYISIQSATEYFVISVRSGKNIFNTKSAKSQKTEFDQLEAQMKTLKKTFHKVVGFGYGRQTAPRVATPVMNKAGQDFWELLTREPDFYVRISDAISNPATVHNTEFEARLRKKRAALLKEFKNKFVESDNAVSWKKVVEFNSARA